MRLLIFFVLCAGCKSKDIQSLEADTDTDTDTDSDTDTDTDSDSDADDADGDGFTADVDCDDSNPDIRPDAADVCDGVDNNCDGLDPLDADSDADGELDCQACGDAGLFASTSGLEGADLRSALHAATDAQNCTSYTDARIFMFDVLDPQPNGMLECVYTGDMTSPDGSTTPGNFNTEHTWPQSQGAESLPARCDLHHLYPTDADANNRRGSFPFGEVTGSTSWEEGGSRLGTNGAGETVFEPREVQKGNTARSILYFAFRYGYTPEPAYHELMVAWSNADPPDADEVARTFVIRDEQGSVNPLVVCPHLVDRL